MSIPFSERPGRHERHYRRRLDNPLFGARSHGLDDASLLEMQRLDHEELLAFIGALRGAVQRAIDLPPNAQSDVVLALKEDLDQLYEESAGLADDQSANQEAILQLLAVIMRRVRAGAAGDADALHKLDEEDEARALHVSLLRFQLVADLLHPQSLVEPADLVPTLLGEPPEAVIAALGLFDDAQRHDILAGAEALAESTGDTTRATALAAIRAEVRAQGNS